MNSNEVVIYRSRTEQMNDHFINEEVYPFVGEHWMAILAVLGVVLICIIVMNWSEHNRRRNRW